MEGTVLVVRKEAKDGFRQLAQAVADLTRARRADKGDQDGMDDGSLRLMGAALKRCSWGRLICISG